MTNPKQGKKRLTLIWLKREIQIAAMHKKLMIIKSYFIRLQKMTNHFSKKKKGQELTACKYLQKKKRKGIKIFRTQYKEARKSAVE